jgi:hypothetical protein
MHKRKPYKCPAFGAEVVTMSADGHLRAIGATPIPISRRPPAPDL